MTYDREKGIYLGVFIGAASNDPDAEIRAKIEWAAELASYGYTEEEVCEIMCLPADDNNYPGDEFHGLAW